MLLKKDLEDYCWCWVSMEAPGEGCCPGVAEVAAEEDGEQLLMETTGGCTVGVWRSCCCWLVLVDGCGWYRWLVVDGSGGWSWMVLVAGCGW